MDSDIIFSQEEYSDLLELEYEVVQVLNGKLFDDGRLPDAQYLALKLFAHGASAYWLFQGTKTDIPRSTGGASYFDFASIAVISRAVLETYLTFFEVFVSPSNEDEFEYQYCLWHLAGQVILEDFEPTDQSLTKNYEDAQAGIVELRERLSATKVFAQLTPKQKKIVLKGRRSRNWKEIASSAGFELGFIRKIYSYCSGFVHADGLTAGKLFSANTKEDQVFHSEFHMITIMISLSKFILQYADLFKEASVVFSKYPKPYSRAKFWSETVSRLD